MSDKIEDDSGKYWPYMILGFLFIGLLLVGWTVKSTIALPVQEENEYMQKYQDADRDAYKIQEAQKRFDSKYKVEFFGLEKSNFKPKFLKRKANTHYSLNDTNSIKFKITSKDESKVDGINAKAVLTRPHTVADDRELNITSKGNGEFEIDNFTIKKPGRYIIRVKFSKDDAVKYLDIYSVKEK